MTPMDDLFSQFENNIQNIQNDLLENFPLFTANVQPVEGLKLGWWSEVGEVEQDISVIFSSLQSQLNSHIPATNEATELEKALRDSLARSMQSAFAHIADPRERTPRTCYSLGDLYKVSKTSRTEMQRRLDDFYISCKRRRVENQHVMLDEMERSLNKTREKVVKHCVKHSEGSGHSSKTRLRRLALPQRTKVPNDIHGMMDGVLSELETFLTEASQRKGEETIGSKSPPPPLVNTKASRGLEAALSTFFIDVSSAKTSSHSPGHSGFVRDEFSTSTDEVQEAYYSCQFPILDFPSDLLPASNGPGDQPGQSDRSDDDKNEPGGDGGDGGGGTGDRGDTERRSPTPSDDDDDLLGDMEVIEELDNAPGEDKETETKNGEEEEKIFIDLSATDDEEDVEILFETQEEVESSVMKEEMEEEEEEEEQAVEEVGVLQHVEMLSCQNLVDRNATSGTRNIFDVLNQSARAKPAAVRTKSPLRSADRDETAMVKTIRNEMDAEEVAAAVSSILPTVSSTPEPELTGKPSADPPETIVHISVPAAAPVSLAERSHESLLQQLISVLDKMVALYEAGEGGARAPPARLEAMLKESFNLVLGSRMRQGSGSAEETARAALSLPALAANVDRTCADFQSHVSHALSSFLMSPASEPPPPPSVGSDRVSGWDFIVTSDAAPALGEEFCVQLDSLDQSEEKRTEKEGEEKEEEEKEEDEEEDLNLSVVTDSDMVCMAVDRVESEGQVPSTLADESSPADESQSTGSPGLNFGNENDIRQDNKEDRPDNSLPMKMTEEDDLLQELFGFPANEETSDIHNDCQEVNQLWRDHYVFLFRCEENPAAREVESLLTRAGASFFDPYHPHLVPSGSQLSVLIHADDAARTHNIPNLLQLKNVRRIRFLLYSDALSCSVDRGIILFPPATSCIVLDADTVANAHQDNLDSLVNFLHEECLSNRPCRLVLHSQLKRLLLDMRLRCRDRFELYRIDQVTQLLTSPRHEGLIEWTGHSDQNVRPDALLFMLKVQRERQQAFRDFFLLSGSFLDPNLYARSGIATMSLKGYLVNYTLKPFKEHSSVRPRLQTESCADMEQQDAPLSWSIDIVPVA